MRKRIVAGLVLLCFFVVSGESPAAAQPAEEEQAVVGKLTFVNSEGNKEPAVGVTVVAEGDTLVEASTDETGAFRLPVPAGTYQVTVTADTLPSGLSLTEKSISGRSVEVEAGRQKPVLLQLKADDGKVAASKTWVSRLPGRFVDGIRFGLILAMCSIGLSLIYGTTRLTNFAHGELVTLGAALSLTFDQSFQIPVLLAGFLGVVFTMLLGGVNELFLWRPLRKRQTGLVPMLIISIGLSIFVRHIILWHLGPERESFSQFAQQKGIEIGPISITPRQITTIVICSVVLAVVVYVIQSTRLGKAMRALADNRDLARTSGINVDQTILVIWLAGAAMAGLGGLLFGLDQQVRWGMGFELLLLIFAAVVLGGLGTVAGAIVGSLVIGVMIEVSTLLLEPELKNVVALLALVAILLVRPQGILGRAERVG